MRRVLEGVGDVVDRKLGRTVDPASGLTTDQIILRMNHMIDSRVRDEKGRGRIAPHHLKLKMEWGTHSETPPEVTKRLETEILAAAIDHINDSRYRTMAPVTIETDGQDLRSVVDRIVALARQRGALSVSERA